MCAVIHSFTQKVAIEHLQPSVRVYLDTTEHTGDPKAVLAGHRFAFEYFIIFILKLQHVIKHISYTHMKIKYNLNNNEWKIY